MTEPPPHIELVGSPRERGLALGRTVGDRIRATAEMYAQAFRLTLPALEAGGRGFHQVVEAFAPDHLVEMEGIAEGARLPLGWILAINARSELRPLPSECTSVAFPATGWYGQTWDWAAEQSELAILVRTRYEDGHRTLTLTEPGMLAKIGISSARVSVCLNALTCYEPLRGVPIHLILRGVLEARTPEEAAAMARDPRGSSGNILLGFENRYLDVEHANHMAFEMEGTGPFAHANHYLGADITRSELPRHRSSFARQARADTLLGGPGDLSHLERILGDTEGDLPILRSFAPHEEFGPYGTNFRICMNPGEGVFRIASKGEAHFKEYALGS